MNTIRELVNTASFENLNKVFESLDVSEQTRQDYKYRIKLFAEFCQSNGFNRNSFLEFKRYLNGRRDLTVSTKNKYLATAKVFLKELNRQGLLPADITQNTKSFSQVKKHKRDGLNDNEISSLTEALKVLPETPQNSRLRAIFCLLALQGLRQIEITRLDTTDLDLASGTASIRGKGRDDKELIYLQPETVKALKRYMRIAKVKSGALFTSQSNNRRNARLTTRAIRLVVRQALTQLGIEKTTHGFRHYFTTKLIKAYKGDLLEVARYTRHRSIEMLQVYNDNIKHKADLPRFYETFETIKL